MCDNYHISQDREILHLSTILLKNTTALMNCLGIATLDTVGACTLLRCGTILCAITKVL